jgi:hypothetical protein
MMLGNRRIKLADPSLERVCRMFNMLFGKY